jgi:ribosomal protein S14
MILKKIQDNKKRYFFFKLEYLKKIYKIININFLNNPLYKKNKKYFSIFLFKIQTNINIISKAQLKNRCIISNRSKSILKPYSISRIKMRELLLFGILPGYSKAAW